MATMTNDPNTIKGINTRSRILQSARELLVQEGYDQVILREVAKRTGIKLGNLQYYFATRDDLLAALFEAEGSADTASVHDSLKHSGTPDDALRGLVRMLVERWRGDSGIVFSTLGFLAIHNPTFRALHRDIYDRFYKEVEAAIECADPGHAQDIYKSRARVLSSLIDGAAQQMQVGPRRKFLDLIADQALTIALPNGATC